MPLTRLDHAYVCPAGHSFDIARSGYVNLLQPQDRRSLAAGDAKSAVAARMALEAVDVGRTLVDAAIERVLAVTAPEAISPESDASSPRGSLPPVVVDLGSGSGEALGRLSQRRAITGIGIDLSTAAAELAARRFPALTWVVTNADRRLPLSDHSVDVVLSINGRRNPAECARVLNERGHLIVALPAPDDLIELRVHVQGHAMERDRVEALLEEHRTTFHLLDRRSIRQQVPLARADLLNLLRATYRGARYASLERVAAIERMEVTLSAELCTFAARRS